MINGSKLYLKIKRGDLLKHEVLAYIFLAKVRQFLKFVFLKWPSFLTKEKKPSTSFTKALY